jgi:porin
LKISWFIALVLLAVSTGVAFAQQDKKTDDDQPADPDTGESTVQESTLGLLPNPFQKYGVKFAATYIGETLGNVSGGLKQGAIYEGRLNLAVDVELRAPRTSSASPRAMPTSRPVRARWIRTFSN